MIPRNLCWCESGLVQCVCFGNGKMASVREVFSVLSLIPSLISHPDCACMCAWTRIHLPTHLSLIFHFSLPPTSLPSQPGMKTSWHLTKGINHPWPSTNYPSLPTLCPPLRGEPCNNSATWKSTASQGRALMDTPVRPCLLRSPGRLTFKSLSLSNSTRTKEAIVQDQGLWPLEMKWRGPLAMRGQPCWKWMILGLREQESGETLDDGMFADTF